MNDRTIIRFKNLLRFSGLFNIISASLLVIPKVYEYYLIFFNQVNTALGLGGQPVTIPDNPLHALFINTAGIDLVLIGAIILVASANPLKYKTIILLNGLGRLLFAGVIVYYVVVADLIRIIVLFGLVDVIISIGFLYFLQKTRSLLRTT